MQAGAGGMQAAGGGGGPGCGCKGIRSCLLCEGPAPAAPPPQVPGRGRAAGRGGREEPGGGGDRGRGPSGRGGRGTPVPGAGTPGPQGHRMGPSRAPPAATPQPGYCELFASITLRAGAHLSLTCYVHIRLLQLSLVACAVFINFPHSAFIAMTNRISAAMPTINFLVPVALRVIGFSLPFQDKDITRKIKNKWLQTSSTLMLQLEKKSRE